jgi:hypothetical protein
MDSRLLSRATSVAYQTSIELICGKKYNLEKATAAATTCWAADVIHPTGHTYAKMALLLLDAIAPQESPRPGGSRQHSKDRGGGGGRMCTYSESESEQWQQNRHTDRARNWAEQRRGHYQQPQPFYRGSGNHHRGRGQFTGEGGGR